MKVESFTPSGYVAELFEKRKSGSGRESAKEDPFLKQAQVGISAICDQFNNSEDRVKEIINKLDPFFEWVDKSLLSKGQISEIKRSLLQCAAIHNKKKFLGAVITVLQPAMEIRKAHAAEFEEAHAKAMNESEGFTEINRLLSYGKSSDLIHIHASLGKTVENKLSLYRSGLRKLAEIIDRDPDIRRITATSPLVAQHPGLFTIAGFAVEDISDDVRMLHFKNEKQEIKRASISREDFLKKFLKK
ncbi:MAG: hypothetical protein AAB400_00505 [Patescibacteria group bacterium]